MYVTIEKGEEVYSLTEPPSWIPSNEEKGKRVAAWLMF